MTSTSFSEDPYEENACHCPDAAGSGSTRRNGEVTGERSVYMSGRYRKVPNVGTQDMDMVLTCQRWCDLPYITLHENARVGAAVKRWWKTQDMAFRLGAIPVLERFNPTQHLIKVSYRTSAIAPVMELGWLTECAHHHWLDSIVKAHHCPGR